MAVAAALLLLGSTAWAGGQASSDPPALRLIKIIPINGTAAKPSTRMVSFDISWVDNANNGLYYLADRSNAVIDVVDTTGAFTGTPDTLFGQIGGNAPGQANFQGDTGTTATSGPDGVTAAFPCIFAGDGNSRLLSFNGNVSFSAVVSALNTGGQMRVDEMAIDPADSLIIAANNADTPPFSTIATYNKTTCALSNPIKTTFLALPGGNTNTNGIEQPVWDPMTHRFYVTLPEINGPGDGTGPNGAVARITTGGVIETIYPINFMQPAGLTLGPNGDLLVGSNSVFDTSGKKCSAVVPAPSPTTGTAAQMAPAHPATCTGVAFPQAAICNPGKGCTPSNGSLVSVPGVGGGDEVWYNSGDGNYYVTAGNDPVGPVFGVVASVVNTLTQLVPTLPPTPLVPLVPPVGTPPRTTLISAGTVHSIAASSKSNHIYVPLPANNNYSDSSGNTCGLGCIAVFSAQ